ncbi:hypothetical protein M434DRAFT_30538 [Hypoxylon sp. CO27-5]|nr:hypothetical protein M434DRAFT_30538 [Hypoxylon sp. CO27-5]
MSSSHLYQYEPLATPDCNTQFPFRILRLLSGTAETLLVGEICHAHLDSPSQPPNYEALSYCWGDANETDRIAIGSAYLHLTHSLCTALFQLRLPSVECGLWIDAICTNQNDVDERSREVQLMYSIHHGANRVLIWLDGPSVKPQDNPQVACKVATRLSLLHNNRPDLNVHKLGRVRRGLIRM